MEKKALSLATILFLYVLPLFGQDFSSFYNISGFHVAPLKSKQYVISLTPSYQGSSSQNDYSASSPGNSYESKSKSPESYFSASSDFLYGLSNETTFSISLGYTPKQSLGPQTTTSTNTYNSGASIDNSSSTFTSKPDNLFSSFVIAHRPRSNFELSLSGYYYSFNSPQNGTQVTNQSNPSGSISSSYVQTSKQQSYSISLGIVILGY